MEHTSEKPAAWLGWTGFVVGAVALVLTMLVIWAGPFAPQQAAGVTLGELAADIAKSAARSVAGQPQPEPEAVPWDLDDYLNAAVSVLASVSVVLGVAALIRHEPRRAAISGIALGGAAVGIQLFTAWVMMIVGALIIMAIVGALKDSFGDIFGGLFNG